MKHLLLTCATIAALASPAIAQNRFYEIRDGERHLIPKEKETQNDEANLIQSRAIEMGFFSWPVPTEKAAADQINRPRQVSDCKGHDADYRPAHEFSAKEEWSVRKKDRLKHSFMNGLPMAMPSRLKIAPAKR
tara:strand:- start:318 stop:716 length:399 start_codon:yes stop_codon:yes gene_type:complete